MLTPLPGQLEPLRPVGPQCFVDWRYLKGGFVAWYDGDTRLAVWDSAPPTTVARADAPFGIRLRAQPAQEIIGPVMPRDKPWEYVYGFSTVLYDEGIYRAWYECVPGDHFGAEPLPWATGNGNVLCYAESDDGLTWRKPDLHRYSYHGQPTNVVYGRTLSPNGFHGGSVFKDPQAPSAERYKTIYMGATPTDDPAAWRAHYRDRFGDDMDPMCFRHSAEQVRRQLAVSGHLERNRRTQVGHIAGAVSPDGIHWTPLTEPMLVHYSDTMTTCYWDAALQRYVGYFRTWRYGRRCIGRAESRDFRQFAATPETILQVPLDFHPSADLYTNAKSSYPGSQDTHLMFASVYHRLDDSREVYLITSVDGINWQWAPGGPVIRRGELGEWHGGDIGAGQGIVPWGRDKIAVPLTGFVHPHKYPRGSAPIGAPGWAIWPKGRLCALEAAERGEFSTAELLMTGEQLSLNLKTRAAGAVWVEVRDEQNQPIPGYTFADADPIVADSLDRRVTWRGQASLGSLAGRPVSFSFRLCHTQLFAFEFVT